MKAVRFNQFGDPEVLEIVDLPDLASWAATLDQAETVQTTDKA